MVKISFILAIILVSGKCFEFMELGRTAEY